MRKLNWDFPETELPPLPFWAYDRVVVAFSGGKDSLACLLLLLSLGVPRSKIELFHHCVDGHTVFGIDEERPLMDWPCTTAYVQAIGKAFGIPVYLSWRSGGFEGEMLRQSQATAPVFFETPNGLQTAGGNSGKLGTRLKFPQPTGDLKTRWCSSSLKIDVCSVALCNDSRFENSNTLFVTGERAQESRNRATYLQNEIHRTDPRRNQPQYPRRFEWLILRSHNQEFQFWVAFLGYTNLLYRWRSKKQRHIDHWRPVLYWREEFIWDIIREFGINPHPAYRLGWARLSCMLCIFGSRRMWASALKIIASRVKRVFNYEMQFDSTIKQPNKDGSREDVMALAASAEPFDMQQADIDAALSSEFTEEIFLAPEEWKLPQGAFGENAGPI